MSQRATQHNLAQPLPSHDAASPSTQQQKVPSPRIPPCPILLHPLPSTLTLTRESLAQSELELDRQTRQRERERALAEVLQEQQWEIQRETAREGMGRWSRKGEKGKERAHAETKGFSTPPQAWELYKAIDKHDIEYIMRVRDHAFGLLLSKHGGEFPIVYAARQGDKWKDVVILIVGALSRYVNYLDEEDYDKKETRNTLKMLRSNLKVAIDNALLPAASAPHLLSSYLQVLIMSEGDVFLNRTINDLVLLLRDPQSQPVAAAEKIIRGFCTKELRGVEGGVGDVEEYVANATLDLVIMGIWALGAGQVGLERLPMHTFARDTRTWTVFRETMAENEAKLGKVSGRVKRMLKVVLEHGGDTHKSVRGRLKDVEGALDNVS